MYKSLMKNPTREYYRVLLDEALINAENRLKVEQTSIWNSIVNQLRDIKEMVIEKQAIAGWEDIYGRYTLGTVAIRELSENDEMQKRLCDIFWGAVHYTELD